MKNTYVSPELLSVGVVNEVVLGAKVVGVPDAELLSLTRIGVLDID